jgi:hypothetical protein
LQKLDKRYIAGFFDGEGSIGIYRNKGSKDDRYLSGYRRPCWVRVVTINVAYKSTLSLIHKQFGGSFRLLYGRDKRWKPIWSWSIGSKEGIKRFLTFILSYIREKKKQAKVMIRVCNNKLNDEIAAKLLKELKK